MGGSCALRAPLSVPERTPARSRHGEVAVARGRAQSWKVAYNNGESPPPEQLAWLADKLRWAGDCRERSSDAFLVLAALTRDMAFIFRAVELAAALPEGEGSVDLFTPAIALYDDALGRERTPTRWRLALLQGRAIMTYSRALEAPDAAGFHAATAALAAFIDALPAGDPARGETIASLAHARLQLANLTQDRDELRRAVASFEEALDSFPADHPGGPSLLLDAAQAAAEIATPDGTPADVQRTLAIYVRAVDYDAQTRGLAGDGAERLAYGLLLRARAEPDGDEAIALLDQSIAGWRTATALGEGDHERQQRYRNNLVAVLVERRERLDDAALLDEEALVLEALVRAAQDDDPERVPYAVNLAGALRERFQQRHERAAIDAAIEWLGFAIDLTSSPDRSLLIARGTYMRERYEYSGEIADADASVSLWQELVDKTSPLEADHAEWTGGLAGSLIGRYAISRDDADLDAAVGAVDAAFAAVAGHRLDAAHRDRLNTLEVLVLHRATTRARPPAGPRPPSARLPTAARRVPRRTDRDDQACQRLRGHAARPLCARERPG